MKSIYMNFASQADVAITDATSRSKILAMAIAVALTNMTPVPTTEVNHPSDFYNTQVLGRIRTVIGEFNENVVFDCQHALEYARTLWLMRYNAAHPASRPVFSPWGTFFESIMGVGTYVSTDLNTFCTCFKTEILTLATLAGEIIATMGEQNA